MMLSRPHPQPLLPPKTEPLLLPQNSNKIINKKIVLQPLPSLQPQPQFVAAKSLILLPPDLLYFVYTVSYVTQHVLFPQKMRT